MNKLEKAPTHPSEVNGVEASKYTDHVNAVMFVVIWATTDQDLRIPEIKQYCANALSQHEKAGEWIDWFDYAMEVADRLKIPEIGANYMITTLQDVLRKWPQPYSTMSSNEMYRFLSQPHDTGDILGVKVRTKINDDGFFIAIISAMLPKEKAKIPEIMKVLVKEIPQRVLALKKGFS